MKKAESSSLRLFDALSPMIASGRVPVLEASPVSVTDLLLRFSKEARRRERADESLFGRFCRNTWRSGSGALDSRQLARDLRRVLTLHHRAHAGGRGETVDLRPRSDRLRHHPGQVGGIRDVDRQYHRVSIQCRGSAELLGRELPARWRFRRPFNQSVEIVDGHEIAGRLRLAWRQGLALIQLDGEVVGHRPIGVLVQLRHNGLQRERLAGGDRQPGSHQQRCSKSFQHVISPECSGTDSKCAERVKRLYESESRSEKKASGLEVSKLGHRIPGALSGLKYEGRLLKSWQVPPYYAPHLCV